MVTPGCECSNTYFDDGLSNVNCLVCEHPCVNCSTTSTTCDTCVERDFINPTPNCTC